MTINDASALDATAAERTGSDRVETGNSVKSGQAWASRHGQSSADVLVVQPGRPVAVVHPLDEVARFIERFVFLKSQSLYRLLSLWVAATHIYEQFDYTGYIFAFSPEPQSGKSRLLEVLELLVANPSGILISPSEAVLFRTADGHTQFMDEVDGLGNKGELRNVLNAGFHMGATVQRMEKSGGEYVPTAFSVYAPRVLAGIGNRILSATTRDRTFGIEMVRQLPSERRKRFHLRMAKPNADEIKTALASWVVRHKGLIVERYKNYDFPYLQELRDRTIDVVQPLAAILEVAYKGEGSEKARRELIEAVTLTRNDQEPIADDHRVLEALASLARDEDPLIGNSTELSVRCAAILGQSPKEIALTVVLRRFGFETKSIRKGGTGGPRYRYSLPLARLDELLARYGGLAQGPISR